MVAGQQTENESDAAGFRTAGLALLPNHAPSAVISYLNAIRVVDSDAVRETFSDQVQVEDRRVERHSGIRDEDSLLGLLERMGSGVFDLSLLATRDHNLALCGLKLRRPDESISETVILASCDDADRLDRILVYDNHDLGRAIEDMSEIHALNEAPGRANVLRVSARMTRAIIERDFSVIKQLLSPDVDLYDHRAEWGAVMDRSELLEAMEGVLGDENDVIDIVTELCGLTDNAVLGYRTQVTPDRLGTVDEELALVVVDADKVVGIELFEKSQLELARQRLNVRDRALA